MALEALTLAQIREWIGSSPDDDSVEDVYLLYGTVNGAALSILKTRLADFEGNPETFAVQGDYSQSSGKNIDALRTKIAQLETLDGSGSSMLTTGRLLRRDTPR